jgi:adenylate cyclase
MDDSLKTSEARLWKLIEERCQPGTDVEQLDRRIWELFGEDWAVMFTDLAGFSRRVSEFGIIHFLQVIHEQRKLLFPVVEHHDGLLIKEEADSLLIIFRKMGSAVDCALAMQRACAQLNQRRTPAEQILLCIGLGCGRILRIGDRDVWGREVNSASRLGEDIARSGEILLTAAAKAALSPRFESELESLSRSPFDDEPCYRLSTPSSSISPPAESGGIAKKPA